MSIILDGRSVADTILNKIKHEIHSHKCEPRLSIIYAGNNSASEIYIRNKQSRASEIGIKTDLIKLPATTSENEIIDIIQSANNDININGIIVQSPIGNIHDTSRIFNSIHPDKDVDGFCDTNIAKLAKGDQSGIIPCTPLGIITLLQHYGISVSGKHVVIIGRSAIVGRPLSLLLSQKSSMGNATVTLCHAHTKQLSTITKLADIIIVAIGKKHFLTEDMISSNSVVIDVGINRESHDDDNNYSLFGDTDFEQIQQKCHAITPVPGGIGPMTVAMLMQNTWLATKKQHGIL